MIFFPEPEVRVSPDWIRNLAEIDADFEISIRQMRFEANQGLAVGLSALVGAAGFVGSMFLSAPELAAQPMTIFLSIVPGVSLGVLNGSVATTIFNRRAIDRDELVRMKSEESQLKLDARLKALES